LKILTLRSIFSNRLNNSAKSPQEPEGYDYMCMNRKKSHMTDTATIAGRVCMCGCVEWIHDY